jgi:predicted dehydrogenase
VSVGFGMIGSGYMARIHATAIADDPALMRLVAVAGGSRAEAFASEFGVTADTSVDALLDRSDIDAVVVATPHTTHLPLVLAAAAAGKHVILEKPMALDVDECDQMIEACDRAGVHLSLAKITRFLDAVKAGHEIVASGGAGELVAIHVHRLFAGYPNTGWPLDPREGGAWLDWGSHGCDVVRWFAGSEPEFVVARASSRRTDIEDLSVMATFEFPRKVLAHLWMTYEIPAAAAMERARYTFVGTDAVVDVNAYGGVDVIRGDRVEPAFRDDRFVGPGTTWDKDAPYFRRAFRDQVANLAEAIRDALPLAVTGADGRAAVAMATAARRSWETNSVVDLGEVLRA